MELEKKIAQLDTSIKKALHDLLDPRSFSLDRGELHVLLQHSKRLVSGEAKLTQK